MKKSVLIIDDDISFLKITKMFLTKHNWDVDIFESWELAKKQYKPDLYSAVLVDLNIGSSSGLDVIEDIKKINNLQPIGMITAQSSVDNVVSALRLGVDDYIAKPCESEEILIRLENMYALYNKELEIETLKNEIEGKYRFHNILTQDEEMTKLCEFSKTIASTDATVLLHGETGTGKELFARAIHYHSQRHKEPFIVVNCAGVNENLLESHLFGHVKGAFTGAHETVKGKFEIAGIGTIFLDEVSETSLDFQKKFLRVLEQRTFEKVGDSKTIECKARVVAATNRNLKEMVEKQEFRKDLYFRLNVVPIHIPPLRMRKEDIPLLARFFMEKFALKFNKNGMNYPEGLDKILLDYNWPGNVRELEHYIEKIVLVSLPNAIDINMFPLFNDLSTDTESSILNALFKLTHDDFIESSERYYFENLMKLYKSDINKIAKHADTAKKTIYAKIKKYSLNDNLI